MLLRSALRPQRRCPVLPALVQAYAAAASLASAHLCGRWPCLFLLFPFCVVHCSFSGSILSLLAGFSWVGVPAASRLCCWPAKRGVVPGCFLALICLVLPVCDAIRGPCCTLLRPNTRQQQAASPLVAGCALPAVLAAADTAGHIPAAPVLGLGGALTHRVLGFLPVSVVQSQSWGIVTWWLCCISSPSLCVPVHRVAWSFVHSCLAPQH